MKKLLLLIVFISTFVNAQIVNIPDANFKAKLLNASTTNSVASTYYDFNNLNSIPYYFNKIDVNNDGEIQYSEVQNIQNLFIENSNITDLTGIEAFVNLKALYCNINQINVLNVSQNTVLRELYCRNTGISNLIIPQNPNLRVLFCDNNQLTNLNISQNPNLIRLVCSYNQLTGINVTQNSILELLSVNNNQLTNLNISQNLNLKSLTCSGNLLTNLDVTNNMALEFLFCGNNLFNNINVTQNNNLKELYCSELGLTNLNLLYNVNLEKLGFSYNQISNIDLTQNPNLKTIWCNNNLLTTLDLTLHPHITDLLCGFNQISTIYLNNKPNLKTLYCQYNLLTSLDVSNNTNLESIWCGYNLLNTLDLNQNSKLISFRCESNLLESLFIKNGKIENSSSNFSNNPNLQYICADEIQIPTIQSQAGSNVLVSSYCDFTPGGNYNTISGIVYYDLDNNGCDLSDVIYPSSLLIDLTNGTVSSGTYPSNNGSYTLYTTTGNHTLSASVENPNYFNITPISSTINFPLLNNSIQTQNFCITANGVHPDLEIVIAPITPARPGFDAVYKIVYKNKGNQTLSGNIQFNYNDAVLDYISSSVLPNSQSIGSLIWNYSNLNRFENRSVTITLNVNSPQEIPAVNIDDVLNFSATINPVIGDETTADNTFAYNQTVVGSYDPNDITCIEGDVIAPTYIGEYLHYLIRFENTGTYQAENVVVKTEINPADFDISTLRLLEASHNVSTRVNGNIIEFIFQTINLDTGGHGNILLKIKTKNNLLVSDIVTNKANIYFDYNFPIETNFANTTFQVLSNSIVTLDNSVGIYPNPANDIVNIKSTSNINSVEIYDVQGRIIQTILTSKDFEVIDISDINEGIYFLMIKTEIGQKVEKIIKK